MKDGHYQIKTHLLTVDFEVKDGKVIAGDPILQRNFHFWKKLAVKTEKPTFTCPECGAISYNPNDIAHSYCGRCHKFINDHTKRTTAEDRG